MNNKGSLLIITVWVLVFFSILNIALYHIVSSQIKIAKRLREITNSTYLAKAAYAYARYQIIYDDTAHDSLYELQTEEERELSGGAFSYKMIDEESKININIASKVILSRVPGFNEELAERIAGSSLRPFKLKQELFAVEGITDDVFTQAAEFITVYGKGRVNINTAGEEVLVALGMDTSLINIINDFRAGNDGVVLTEDDMFFEGSSTILKQLSGFTGLFQQQQAVLIQLSSKNLLGVSGENFRLQVDTKISGKSGKAYEIVMDEEKILLWREN
ncbi:MAG: helix-hairpin-helix domain-containing protein [Candidatus Omnitrophica bacterium]|nr:helix-hairpin-helix domain-containing protein [Candidatus Omnitrophota bacterium]